MSGPARAKRAAEVDKERQASDADRLQHTPAPDLLAEQIRNGGQLSFVGEMAYLNVVNNTATSDGEGTTTYTSTSNSVPFALQDGVWMMGD